MSKWEYSERELWRFGEKNIAIYHVFSTVAMGQTVMVFAEARYGDGSDADCPHDIRMRKSTDGGRSFGEERIVCPAEGRLCWINPCPIWDEVANRVFLFYEENLGNTHTRLYLIYSDDCGESWSAARELTDAVGVDFTLTGPGHGICLKRGPRKGRLLMPLWHRGSDVTLPADKRGYCVSLLSSDDRGESWQWSGTQFGEAHANESRLTETEEGILWHLRTKSDCSRTSRSVDGGETWSETAILPIPPAKSCDSGAVSLCGKAGYENTFLLARVSHPEKRRDMEIQISTDGGVTFAERFALPAGDAMPGYCDLCVIEEEASGEPVIGLLHCRSNHVLFSRISLQTLTGGKYENTTRSVWL